VVRKADSHIRYENQPNLQELGENENGWIDWLTKNNLSEGTVEEDRTKYHATINQNCEKWSNKEEGSFNWSIGKSDGLIEGGDEIAGKGTNNQTALSIGAKRWARKQK
jgi:hypothetical protein